jgi:hypothetical protein
MPMLMTGTKGTRTQSCFFFCKFSEDEEAMENSSDLHALDFTKLSSTTKERSICLDKKRPALAIIGNMKMKDDLVLPGCHLPN